MERLTTPLTRSFRFIQLLLLVAFFSATVAPSGLAKQEGVKAEESSAKEKRPAYSDLKPQFQAALKDKKRYGELPEMIAYYPEYYELLKVHRRLTMLSTDRRSKEGKAAWEKYLKETEELEEEYFDDLSAAFKKTNKHTDENRQVWTACIDAASLMGSGGGRMLFNFAKDKRFRGSPTWIARCLQKSLAVKARIYGRDLNKYLQHEDVEVATAAAEVLKNYGTAPGKDQQLICKTCVKLLKSMDNPNVELDGSDQLRRERLRPELVKLVRLFTGQNYDDREAFAAFWKKKANSKKFWED